MGRAGRDGHTSCSLLIPCRDPGAPWWDPDDFYDAAGLSHRRLISVERGHDPREYTLIAFGGAGGQHAAELSAALGIRCIVVPWIS